jgi:hypothetical protein
MPDEQTRVGLFFNREQEKVFFLKKEAKTSVSWCLFGAIGRGNKRREAPLIPFPMVKISRS